MPQVQVILNVDQEVANLGQAMLSFVNDIERGSSIFKYAEDVIEKLLPLLGQVGSLSSDFKTNPDNRRYLAMAIEQAGELFLLPLPNRPTPQAEYASEP